MSYVITDPCVGVCDTACVNVCPVDCIHGPLPLDELRAIDPSPIAIAGGGRGGKLQMYIEPNECICCGMCVSECPVSAIFDEDDVPAEWTDSIERNRAFFARP